MNYKRRLLERSRIHPFDSVSTHVQEILLESIISGELSGGTVLNQSELAAEFDLSRSPIRQALGQLALDGFVTKSDQGVFSVYQFRSDDYSELIQFRIQLETLAIQRASLYRNEEVISRLRTNLSDFLEATRKNDTQEALKLDADFHATIIYASKNRYIINCYLQYARKIDFFRVLLSSKQNMSSTYRLHEKILNSIEERNPEAGVRYMKQHLMLSDELGRLD